VRNECQRIRKFFFFFLFALGGILEQELICSESFFVLNPPFGVFITDEEALGYGA
jgi:hypothetical protein